MRAQTTTGIASEQYALLAERIDNEFIWRRPTGRPRKLSPSRALQITLLSFRDSLTEHLIAGLVGVSQLTISRTIADVEAMLKVPAEDEQPDVAAAPEAYSEHTIYRLEIGVDQGVHGDTGTSVTCRWPVDIASRAERFAPDDPVGAGFVAPGARTAATRSLGGHFDNTWAPTRSIGTVFTQESIAPKSCAVREIAGYGRDPLPGRGISSVRG
ncbi:transposase family protein, partial [Rathayibacter iranicus]|uniref:transposase family protein n=2 Tax=Rathayibacter iranicus TaxID=59737 RepID=UPI000D4DFABD